MLCMDPTLNRSVRQMKSYPGPLTLADTHKDVVVRYCEQQAAEAAKNQALPDGDSVTLIWEYLALLVKQNGKLYGSDVAGLLLKSQEVMLQPQHSASQSSQDDVSETSPPDGSPQDEGIDIQSPPLPPPRDESALLKKFTEYLCLGRKKEAVDYAMREGLWGHALALSYKMDSTTHTRVLAAFSNSIPRNDVLITLFQQLSGKRPEVTKNYTPHQWGNWRQHLAMMVSNPTGQSPRDKASIVALGETLASRGQLHAAHFCYLVAEAEWGCFSNKESKLVLIGSSHHLPFQAFATNEAIQCTEIFEFAQSLDTSNPTLEMFQSYKLIYALRLAEFGFPSEALRYCEVISQIVSKNPNSYQGDFLSQVYELASRLKYHDLHYHMYEGEVAEMPDPKWLTNLRTVVDIVKQEAAEQMAAEAPQDHQSYNQGYHTADTYQGSGSTPDLYPQVTKSATETYQQGITDTSYQQGVADTSSYQQGHGTPDHYQGHVATGDVTDNSYSHHVPSYSTTPQSPGEGTHTPVIPNEVNQSSESLAHTQESVSPQTGSVPMMMQPQQNQSQYAPYGTNYWTGYTQPDPNASSSYLQSDSAEAMHTSLPPSPEVSSEHRTNSVASMSQPNSLSSYPTYPQPYQPWDQQHGSSNTVSQPQSNSSEPVETTQRTPEEEAYWAEMAGKKDEYDEFGGDVYEYEDIEEVGARVSDCEVDYQLRHRHPTSLVSTEEPVNVTSTVHTTQQLPPSPQPFEPPKPKEDPKSEIPMFMGFPTTTTTKTTHPARLEPSTSSSTLSKPLPMFQPLSQQQPLLSSPLPPPLAHNSHVMQTSNDGAELKPTDKDKMGDEKKKDRDSDDKNSGWSIGSLFGWKKSKQAVLPDDKNPSIVWNEEKKRWENKDGGEEVHSPPPPPPKSIPCGPGAPPITMSRAGPRKSRYVNTEKDPTKPPPNGPSSMLPPMSGGPPIPSGSPMLGGPPMASGPPMISGPPMPSGPPMASGPPMPGGPPMASGPPMIPSGAPMPPTFMVPGSMPQQQEGDGSSSPQQPQILQQEQQLQNPSLPQTPPTSIPDISLGTSNDGGEGAVPMMAPPGQPQFFNPNQFNPTTAPNPAQTRRVGPGKRLYQGKR